MPSYWNDPYRPLRVVAHMTGPVAIVPGEPVLPLDALLEYAAFQARWPAVFKPAGGGRMLPRLSSSDPANFCIPIKRHGHKVDPDWFWCASWAVFPAGFEQDRQHWNRRFDGADPELTHHLDFGGRRGNIPVALGRYKAYHMPICLVVAPVIEWHCLGAADGVATLLTGITHLGHKRSQGWGEVRSWEVWPAREDRSLFDADGAPARALPMSYFSRRQSPDPAWRRLHCAIRSPSWHPSRRRECACPAVPLAGLVEAAVR